MEFKNTEEEIKESIDPNYLLDRSERQVKVKHFLLRIMQIFKYL